MSFPLQILHLASHSTRTVEVELQGSEGITIRDTVREHFYKGYDFLDAFTKFRLECEGKGERLLCFAASRWFVEMITQRAAKRTG